MHDNRALVRSCVCLGNCSFNFYHLAFSLLFLCALTHNMAAPAPAAAPAAAAVAVPGAAGGDVRAAALAMISGLPDAAADRVDVLKAEKKRLAGEKKRIAIEEKKEKQKRRRLMAKAKDLSDQELLSIIANRAQAKAKGKARAKAKR